MSPPDPTPPRRRNRRGEATERLILDEAIRFCAETGFDWQTRVLAQRLGLSHAAIYRHFDSKEAVIERVYTEVYEGRWDPSWEALIADRSRPLAARMRQFYYEYADRILDYQWVRIFVSSGVKGYGLPARYLSKVHRCIIAVAAAELREAHPEATGLEELLWALHGSVFYIGIRKFVYDMPVDEDIHRAIGATVDVFFAGLEATLPREA